MRLAYWRLEAQPVVADRDLGDAVGRRARCTSTSGTTPSRRNLSALPSRFCSSWRICTGSAATVGSVPDRRRGAPLSSIAELEVDEHLRDDVAEVDRRRTGGPWWRRARTSAGRRSAPASGRRRRSCAAGSPAPPRRGGRARGPRDGPRRSAPCAAAPAGRATRSTRTARARRWTAAARRLDAAACWSSPGGRCCSRAGGWPPTSADVLADSRRSSHEEAERERSRARRRSPREATSASPRPSAKSVELRGGQHDVPGAAGDRDGGEVAVAPERAAAAAPRAPASSPGWARARRPAPAGRGWPRPGRGCR